jgi:hypothetical protein
MAIEPVPPEPDLPNIRKHLGHRQRLWRLCGWGGAAAIALAAVVITSQTESGSQRLQLVLAKATEPVTIVAAVPPRVIENEAETQRLAAKVHELTADRDRLTARIASLEHNLDDMTGSIKRQAELAKASPPAPSATRPPPPQVGATAPAPSAPATAAAAPPVISPLAMAPNPASAETAAPWHDTPQEKAKDSTEEAPPLPPARVVTAPAGVPLAEPPPLKPEYGVDLGSAANLELLQAHWAAVKANYGPLLGGLHPVAVQDRRPGHADFRIVAGPLPNFTAARALCSRFATIRAPCRPTRFAGEKLTQP